MNLTVLEIKLPEATAKSAQFVERVLEGQHYNLRRDKIQEDPKTKERIYLSRQECSEARACRYDPAGYYTHW